MRLEKLIFTKLVKKFLAFYGNRVSVAVFYEPVICANLRKMNPCFFKIHLLSSHPSLRLQRDLFFSVFPGI